MNIRKFLSDTFLFKSFAENELNLLESSTSLKKVHRGEQIFPEGYDASEFFIIVSGKVKIYKVSTDGKEHTLHIHGPGDLVAEAAIFHGLSSIMHCLRRLNSCTYFENILSFH